MLQIIKDYECPYCYKHFMVKRGGFSNHMRYCNCNPNSKENRKLTGIKQKEYLEKQKQLEKETEKEYIFICKECKNEYKLILSKKQFDNHKYSDFCSIKCARKYSSSKVSNELKEVKCIDCGKTIYIKNRGSDKNCRCKECQFIHSEPLKKCIVCNKEFRRHNAICCSKECSKEYNKHRKKYLSEETLQKFQEIGKKSAKIQSEIRRSKNEIEFCKLCENYFDNVEHNKAIFNGWDADIILPNLKIAILWNGKWHYEQIMPNTSLKQIQNRDNIKIKEIEKFGYIPYIIKDVGYHKTNFVQEKFDEFIEFLKQNNYI